MGFKGTKGKWSVDKTEITYEEFKTLINEHKI